MHQQKARQARSKPIAGKHQEHITRQRAHKPRDDRILVERCRRPGRVHRDEQDEEGGERLEYVDLIPRTPAFGADAQARRGKGQHGKDNGQGISHLTLTVHVQAANHGRSAMYATDVAPPRGQAMPASSPTQTQLLRDHRRHPIAAFYNSAVSLSISASMVSMRRSVWTISSVISLSRCSRSL